MQDNDFVNILRHCDLIGLLETWSEAELDYDNVLPGFTSVFKAFPRTSKFGHAPGGIGVLIRDNLCPGIKVLEINTKHVIPVLLNKVFFDLPHNLIVCFTYLPPEGSTSYEDEQNGVAILQDTLTNLYVENDDCLICVIGDLNARTGVLKDYIVDDGAKYLPMEEWYEESTFYKTRNSQDKDGNINNFGFTLLDMCKACDMHILNGRSKGDPDGSFTYISPTGCSLIDYVLLHCEVFDWDIDLTVEPFDISDHLPLKVKIGCNTQGFYESQRQGGQSAKEIQMV